MKIKKETTQQILRRLLLLNIDMDLCQIVFLVLLMIGCITGHILLSVK